MKSIFARFEDFLDNYFHVLIGIIAFILYKRYQAKISEEKQADFTNALFGMDTPEVEKAKAVTKTVTGSGKMSDFLNPSKNMNDEQLKAYDTIKRNEAKNLAASYASRLRSAMNPSGTGWMRSVDGTSVGEINSIFSSLKYQARNNKKYFNMNMVFTAYKDAYKDDLREHLESELSSTEVAKLMQL